MKEYELEITATATKCVRILANSEKEALQKAEDNSNDYILAYTDEDWSYEDESIRITQEWEL